MIHQDLEFHNVVELEPSTTGGVTLRRFPSEVRQSLCPLGRMVSQDTAGCEIRCVTEAPSLRLAIETQPFFLAPYEVHGQDLLVFRGAFFHSRHMMEPGKVNGRLSPKAVITRHQSGKWHTILRFSTLLLCFVLLLGASSDAAIKSRNGILNFDCNNDGVYEAVLTTSGLGIGTAAPSENLHVNGNVVITGNLRVGSTVGGGSNLEIGGTIGFSNLSYGAGSNIIGNSSVVIVDTSSGNAVLTLPPSQNGQVLEIIRTSSLNSLFIAGAGNQMDGLSTLEFPAGNLSTLSLYYNGSAWYVLGKNSSETLTEVGASDTHIHWKLDETSGNTASGSDSAARAGNLTGTFTFSGNTLAGPLSNAVSMGNVNDAITNLDGVSFGASGYTYSFWFKANHLPSETRDFESTLSGVAGFCYTHGESGMRQSAYHQKNDGSMVFSQITTTLSANTWYHVASTWNGSSLEVYLNGVLESGNTSATNWSGAGNVTLSHPSTYTDGVVHYDDVRVFGTSLTPHAISALYKSGAP